MDLATVIPAEAAAVRTAKNPQAAAIAAVCKTKREEIIAMLNGALATELVCVLRYKRHHFMLTGRENAAVKAEFLEHALEEEAHVNQLAERIVQLNGAPDFNPASLMARSHAEYDDSSDVKSMLRSNLISERIAIEAYRRMIEQIGDTDPTTRDMLISIMSVEEEHADEMAGLMI